jgi:hypothetical protein
MAIILYGKCLESALPHMAATVIMPMIPSDMSRHQPLHPGTLMKYLRTAITAIYHMMTHVSYTGSCCSWHNNRILTPKMAIARKKV